jgi:hypothetical protein
MEWDYGGQQFNNLWNEKAYCESFSPLFGYRSRISTVSATMKRTDARTWAPSIPKVVDLSHGSMATEHGIQKSEFDNFIANETSSYCGYKWELIDNIVHIYDMADYPVIKPF